MTQVSIGSPLNAARSYLLVDDHAGFRQTLRDILPSSRGRVTECANGVEAVEAYRRHQADVVIMDVEMPEMDGLSATQAIRSQYPEAHVIVVTMYDSAEIRRAAEEAGASAFVTKDKLADLVALLKKH